MSGETPPTGSSRFQSMGKKYPNSSMSPGNSHSPSGGRGGHNRSRVLASKVSAPRPINLPSLRRENANSAEWSGTASTAPAVPSGGGWGNSPSMSPFSLPQKWDNTTAEAKHESQNNNAASPEPHPSPVQSKTITTSDASPSSPPNPQASRAWGTASSTSTPTTSAEFPTAPETAPPENDPEEKSPKTDKQQVEKSRGNEKKLVTEEIEHLDWDEIVREDLEKESSLEFAEDEPVLPSDRFTEDYDRSYPPQIHPVMDEGAHGSSGFHRGPPRRDNTWGANNNSNNNNNNNAHNHDWNGYTRSSSQERRTSGDRGAWGRREQGGNSERGRPHTGRFGNRRPSHDRKSNFQPTVLQRPRRMSELSARSDRSSREEASEPHHPQQTSPTVLPAVIEGTSSGRPTELTAAQREVMLSAAERAKKRRDEEEAEYQAARERARKKAEALAALSESKPKPPKSEEKKSTDDSKLNENQQTSSSNDSEPAKLSQRKESSPISIEKPSPEEVKSSESTKVQETKAQSEKATIPEKAATVRDASPSNESSSKARRGADKSLNDNDNEEDDNKQWDSFVEGIRDNKTVEKKGGSDSNASAWNAYATRLQATTESRMNAAIDKYAAERNLDPSMFDDMRQRDREPLRLPRHRETGRRNNRDRDRDRKHNRDEGKKRSLTGKRESTEDTAAVEQQDVSFELWPTLGQGASTDGEKKVPVAGEKDTFKKRNQDKTVDKNASGQKVDSVDEREESVADESGKSKMSDSEHTGRDEALSVDGKTCVSKRPFIAGLTDSSSEKLLADTDDKDDPVQEAPSGRKHSPEDDELLPEMIEASESGSHISHTVPTPESESIGRGKAFSAEAVFEHWTRAKRHEFLQKAKGPIFPQAIERLVEFKPANLTFRTVHDENLPAPLHMQSPLSTGSQSPLNEEYLADKQHAASSLLGNPSLVHPTFASPYEGELSPQLMPPMTTAMSGRHNYPLLVYQVPYNNRAPFIPGSAAYGVSADSQPSMFIPTSPVQQPLQQHHHQQQPVMGVYLLPPQQMLPPWPGMPVNINNQRRRH